MVVWVADEAAALPKVIERSYYSTSVPPRRPAVSARCSDSGKCAPTGHALRFAAPLRSIELADHGVAGREDYYVRMKRLDGAMAW